MQQDLCPLLRIIVVVAELGYRLGLAVRMMVAKFWMDMYEQRARTQPRARAVG